MLRTGIFLLIIVFLTGCGVRLTPVLAGFEHGLEPVTGEPLEARPGDMILSWADRFLQPAYAARLNVATPEVRGHEASALQAGRVWVNWWRMEDGSLVIEPRSNLAAGLGLRVDATGTVLGNKPWIDVRRGVRPSQELWGVRPRLAFQPSRGEPQDVFLNELVYVGMEGGSPAFEHRMRKLGPVMTEATPPRRFVVRETVDFQGLIIRVLGHREGALRYRMELPAGAGG